MQASREQRNAKIAKPVSTVEHMRAVLCIKRSSPGYFQPISNLYVRPSQHGYKLQLSARGTKRRSQTVARPLRAMEPRWVLWQLQELGGGR